MPLKSRSEAGREEECIEREAFLLVLRELETVKGSPWQVLRETVLPKYEALKALEKRAVSPYRARQGQDYLAYRSEQERREEALTESLVEWAGDCSLVEQHRDRSESGIVRWLLDHARLECEKWHAEKAPPINTWCKNIPSTHSQSKLPEQRNQFWIRVDGRLPDESLKEFNKRVRAAVTARLRELGRRSLDLRAPAGFDLRRGSRDRRRRGPGKLDHYRWLVLYQCCRWTLRRIRKEYFPTMADDSNEADNTMQRIWQGVQSKSHRLGLEPRQKADSRKRHKKHVGTGLKKARYLE